MGLRYRSIQAAANISPVTRVTSHDRGGVARGGGQIVIKTGEDALRLRDAKHGSTERAKRRSSRRVQAIDFLPYRRR